MGLGRGTEPEKRKQKRLTASIMRYCLASSSNMGSEMLCCSGSDHFCWEAGRLLKCFMEFLRDDLASLVTIFADTTTNL